ncbi:MAG: pitrilysin family protein [Leptolyngbyaceae cyanobacterium bins.59]|nr:pitrilysin family protein [Leptolyngbyaceae cyanobacterium bins.59]
MLPFCQIMSGFFTRLPKLQRSSLGQRILSCLLVAALCWNVFPRVAFARTDAAQTSPQTSQSGLSVQPYLDRVVDRVTEFTLTNGLKFIVLERHQAPVVSFLTYADVGGADEPNRQTGVAHFLEHLAFKGTTRIGTTNYTVEQKLLDRLDALDTQIQKAKTAGKTEEAARLQAEFEQVEAEAAKLVEQNELGRIVEQSGGVGLNANTSTDATRYFYSFPSNKLELWMSLESERFLDPVFREFYKEKDVILEERRLRVDNSPIGTLVEAMLDKAFQVHPYRRPVIGYNQDIRNLTRENVQKFFETYYVPNNLTIAIVGDVNPPEVKRLAEIYFGRYKAGSKPPQVTAVEPPQKESREVTLRLPAQPLYMAGYHRPGVNHPDHVIYELINSILSDGRTSRLYKSLVEQQRVALTAQGFSGFPGSKFPNLLVLYAVTAPGRTVDEVARSLDTEIERLRTEPVAASELERVKTQARAALLRSLTSNMGMAQLLLEYEVKTGSWRNLFKELDAIAAVTPADIQRVARSTFRPENRTVAKLLSAEKK